MVGWFLCVADQAAPSLSTFSASAFSGMEGRRASGCASLAAPLSSGTSSGKVLIFVTKKANAAELARNMDESGGGVRLGLLHGDMHQDDRNKVISEFKKSDEMKILVATDVAARGLDIPAIKTVINYDVARDIDTHTHRIGRTGRAGEKGVAYTLVTAKDKEFAPHLVRNLETTDQQVPRELVDLALQVKFFSYLFIFYFIFYSTDYCSFSLFITGDS